MQKNIIGSEKLKIIIIRKKWKKKEKRKLGKLHRTAKAQCTGKGL